MPRSTYTDRHGQDAIAPALPLFFDNKQQICAPAPQRARPKSLTIRFSRASDLPKVVELYTSPLKDRIDPQNFVRPRTPEELAGPVRNGAAALAIDENGEIRASALAAHYADGKCGKKNITEIGAVLCDVGGVGLAKAVLAMLSLKQTFDPRASGRVYAKVARDNTASNTVFAQSMGWERVECAQNAGDLYDVAYRKAPGARDRLWYHFTESAADRSVDILKSCVERSALQGRDGSQIRLDIEGSSLWSTLHFHEMLARPEAIA